MDEEKILKYLPLVKQIAMRIRYNLPRNVELDDMINSGILGLIDAFGKYNKNIGIKFEYYASIRIRGSILDELRKADLLPRSARQRKKEIEKAYLELEKDNGSPPSDEEVAEYLNIDIKKFRELLYKYRGDKIISFKAIKDTDNDSNEELLLYYLQDKKAKNPAKEMFFEELKKVLNKAIIELPEREKLLISLYYYEELNQKEIAEIMNITESRVSQLKSQALMRLKAKIDKFYSINAGKGGKNG